MTQSPLQDPQAAGASPAEQIRVNMRLIERRQWWLWSSGVLVMILLTLCVASFAFPGLLAEAEASFSFYVGQAVRGLVGLVLLFNIYVVYQQLQIHRIQRQLTEQVDSLGKMEMRTDEVYKLAVLDGLTGLYNRRSGEQRLAEEISRSQRHGGPLTVLLVDLDELKSVNDKFGHAVGDDLIKHFAERLRNAIRGSDVPVRQGGDEFLVVLPECKPEDVQHVLGRLNSLKMGVGGQTIPLSFSKGWTNYRPGELVEELMKRADDALYVDKRSKKESSEQPIAIA